MPAKSLTLDDLSILGAPALHQLMVAGHPLDRRAMADTRYLGVDLSLPPVLGRLLWKTFRKTFHQDPETGALRGWNVRMEQHGVEGPRVPMTDRRGRPLTFGHYEVRAAAHIDFPRGWRGADYLDYTEAGNKRRDVGRFGYTPLVAVNEGSSDLLLGWEVFKVGPTFLPLPLYYALKLDGPLEDLVHTPRPGLARFVC